MYPQLKNIFKPNSKSVMKLSLGLKGLIATIAGSAFMQGNAKFAFYALVAGAVIDFIISLLPPDAVVNDGSIIKDAASRSSVVIVGVLVCSMLSGCWSQRPVLETKTVHADSTVTNNTSKDTTFTTYKAINLNITGAKVQRFINLDSLYRIALIQRQQHTIDSLKAVADGKPIPLPSKPVIQYYTDPQTKAELAYWIDAYGKFQVSCESKDQTITVQQAQITVLRKQVTDRERTISELQNKTITVFKVPRWAWWVMGISVLINALGGLFIYSKLKI